MEGIWECTVVCMGEVCCMQRLQWEHFKKDSESWDQDVKCKLFAANMAPVVDSDEKPQKLVHESGRMPKVGGLSKLNQQVERQVG